jgi:5-methylcytosine-specific restriction endonuclease McrA
MNAEQRRVWEAVLERDGGCCLDCLVNGRGRVAAFGVHHIASRRRPWAWCVENMISLCYECHQGNRDAHTHARRMEHLAMLRDVYGYEHDDKWREWSA